AERETNGASAQQKAATRKLHSGFSWGGWRVRMRKARRNQDAEGCGPLCTLRAACGVAWNCDELDAVGWDFLRFFLGEVRPRASLSQLPSLEDSLTETLREPCGEVPFTMGDATAAHAPRLRSVSTNLPRSHGRDVERSADFGLDGSHGAGA